MLNLARTFKPLMAVFAVGALSLAVVACGDDDDGDSSPSPTETSTSSASPSASASASASAEPTGDVELSGDLIIYSGRSEDLIGPIIEQFEEESGLNVDVRYGSTPEIAATILEEGGNTPADVYIGQDAGSVGLLAQEGFFAPVDEETLQLVPEQYRAGDGSWVGLSGRVRVVAYNTEMLSEEQLPDTVFAYTEPEWEGRVGWAPTNASFQSFVTAMRVAEGDDATRDWLQGMIDNGVVAYSNNVAILEAVAAGEVEVGFVNHYYLQRFIAEQGESFPARNYYFTNGDIGGLMNVAGAGVLSTSENADAAQAFIRFMLNDEAQQYFAEETTEFPLVEGVDPPQEGVPPLSSLTPVDIDLTNLADLEATLAMLQEVGAIQ